MNMTLTYPPLPILVSLGCMRDISSRWKHFSDNRKMKYIHNVSTQIESRRKKMNDWITLDTFDVDY